jgi:hypothetical protein
MVTLPPSLKRAPPCRGRIATEERVVDGHLAASADEQAATAFVGFPIDERKSFEGQVHPIDPQHPHVVTTIKDDRLPAPIQSEIARGLAFLLMVSVLVRVIVPEHAKVIVSPSVAWEIAS